MELIAISRRRQDPFGEGFFSRATRFKFTADGKTAYLAIQHSGDTNRPKVDDYATDDIIKITGFKIPYRFQQ